MVRAGRYRHRLTLYREVQGPEFDTRGQLESCSTDVATVWARVEPLRGAEGLLVRQLDSTLSHRITIRYSTDVDAIDDDWWFEDGRRKFNIGQVRTLGLENPNDDDERDVRIECLCVTNEIPANTT